MASIICEKSYAVDARYPNFYTGGEVAWSEDGKLMYCMNNDIISVVDISTGQVVKTITTNIDTNAQAENQLHGHSEDDVEGDSIYTFALANHSDLLATAHHSGLLRLWSLDSGKVIKIWKAHHKGPVVKLQFSTCEKLLCSSGADSTLRMWDFLNSRCSGVLKDFQGPALVLQFHPSSAVTQIFAAGANNTIYCWDYLSKRLVKQLCGHLSHVTAISFQNNRSDCKYLASVSRDKVLIVWRLDTGVQYKVVPMYEELEGALFLRLAETDTDVSEIIVATATGNLKLVDYELNKVTTIVAKADYEIKLLLHCKQSDNQRQMLAVITAEQNILIYNIVSNMKLACCKQLIGFNDEILDLCFIGHTDRFLAVATNSKNIKVYDTANEMNCKIISGHQDTVMTLSATNTNNFLLSAGKDFSIFLWEVVPDTFSINCIAKNCSSHTATIGGISFGYNLTDIFASVCQDGSLKVWNLKQDNRKSHNFTVKYAAVAHEKEINCVTFAPNNKLLATASQDKTAKLWSCESAACIGTLRGHMRGIWCVRFSPVDQVVFTTSSDGSIRIWSVANLTCLKRLEAESSILRAEFVEQGRYIITGGSDGLLKIWSIKANECVQTIDEHSARVWCIAISTYSKKYFYSGGADSKLIRWQDVTAVNRNLELDKRKVNLQQEQTLQTLLQQQQNTQKAFVLALTLGKPKVTYNIICRFVRQRNQTAVQNVISQLNSDQRTALMEHIKSWSTNTRYSNVANLVLQFILNELMADAKQRLDINFVEVLTPYVQRHFNRVNELSKDLAFLEFVVDCI